MGPQPRPLGRDVEAFLAPELPPAPEQMPPQFADRAGPISLGQALSLALLRSPRLAAFSWEVRAQEARALQASLAPNPELEFEIESFGGTGEVGGFRGAETTLALEQLLELGGKRGRRHRLASLDRDLAAWDYESQRLQVVTEVTKAFVAVLAAQERVVLADDLIRIAVQALQTVTQRVRAGAASPVESTRARVALATSRVDRNKARRALAAARTRLAAMWGSTTVDFTEATGDLSAVRPPPSLDDLSRRALKNPDLARWVAELQQREAAVAVEQAQRVPDVTVGAGVRRLGETDDTAFVVQASIPLLLFQRNQGGILEARHRLAKAAQERRAAQVKVFADLTTAYEALRSSFEEAAALKDEVIPEARLAFETAEGAYRRGLFRYLDVLDAQRTLFEVRGRHIDALAAYHQAVAEMERLIAEPLTTAGDLHE